ncbi:MAG TPA: glycoside hydrolase family 127 protein, partial [Clostridiales bacterium]|nr:glycoside hydrolase family 127 protein [Clostridiales bacterium]
MNKDNINEIKLSQVIIKDEFWSDRQRLITDTVIPYQELILDDKIESVEKSHAFANFRIAAGIEDGDFYGMVFQDSDVAKWLEAVAYSLSIKPDRDLEYRADEIIAIIAKAQQEDGYLNTYFTIKEPDKRWTNLHACHELYCAGHMMEAAVAYYKATAKEQLLNVMERMSDHIEKHFVTEQREGIPGHQEIEIGLMKMYHATGKEKFFNLAKHFIDERGQKPDYFIREDQNRGWHHDIMDPRNTNYNQSYAPVREQKTAEGHSVRAVYMYTAMADIASVNGDKELYNACKAIWNNIVTKRMYITGGIGSNAEGEAFTLDYDLPNDSIYGETCASIGLIFFAKKMLDIYPSNQYADIMELALYNGVLSGMQLDGKRFFYVNPLEVNPDISGKLFGYKHVLPERPDWYQCACCPPNVARLLTSLGQYIWSEGLDTIYS